MTDNTDEEHLDNPISNQSENPPDEIIPAADKETVNPNQETENMEVHHHAHHEGKKNWKSYFWEFLMLFLAVFCGFLAEYQLEHVIEHSREEQFMISLVEDLESDTAELNNALKVCESVSRYTDSVLIFLSTYKIGEVLPAHFDDMIGTAGQRQNHINTDRTSTQLKNSGSMRLIRNKHVSDAILRYWKSIDASGVSLDRYMIYREAGRVISFKLWVSQLVYNRGMSVPLDSIKTLRVIDPDKKKWDEMANLMATGAMITQGAHTKNLTDQLNQANQLIALIKKEYHLN
jgi:hypothetical protein